MHPAGANSVNAPRKIGRLADTGCRPLCYHANAMNEATALPPIERPRRFHFEWVLPVLFRARRAMAAIVALPRSTWFTPLLILSLTALLAVAASGPLRQAQAISGQMELPEGSQWWTPEQIAAFQQTQAALSGPVFIYVLPALAAVVGVWLGWLLLGALLHLALTLVGGRDTTGAVLNVVAWASLPFALRDLVRAAFTFFGKTLVDSPGLAGFAPAGEGPLFGLVYEALKQVDLYGLWFIVLLIIGVRAAGGLPRGKVILVVLLVLLVGVVVSALPGLIAAQFSGLQIVRPFLF
jgi:hypothetical protein